MKPPSPIHVVVYISSETSRFSDRELTDLLHKSREHNNAFEITGLLLYKDGNFMQILEGPKEPVLALLDKIKSDPRHRGVTVLMSEEAPHREFNDWSMGFKRLNPETCLECPGYSDFLDVPLTSERFQLDPAKSLRFLLVFKR